MAHKLALSFYEQDTLHVAKSLLGMHLVRFIDGQKRVGRIVETEAYQGPHDLAAHTAGGRRTARNETMYGPAGRAYVYFIYGMFHCMNVVTREVGTPHGVLIRALEPVLNIKTKTSGPGLLCRAMHIDLTDNGVSLRGNELWIERPSAKQWRAPLIKSSPRIGVDYAGLWAEKPWRYFDDNSSRLTKRRAQARST